MQSRIAQALALRFPPLALFFSPEIPATSRKMKSQCSMFQLAAAARGETVVMASGVCDCPGALEGFGLESSCPDKFPGGQNSFLRFLSTGNKDCEAGRTAIQQLIESGAPKILVEEFSEGEGFLKSPELVAQYLEELPQIVPEYPHVVIKPLDRLKPGETPKVITLLVDPDQLSALVVLANYARPGVDNVSIPFSAGCASVALYPFYESEQEHPRAVVGLTDISARFYLRKSLGSDILSFTVPKSFFEEMEENVSESFLTRFTWKSMMGTGKGAAEE